MSPLRLNPEGPFPQVLYAASARDLVFSAEFRDAGLTMTMMSLLDRNDPLRSNGWRYMYVVDKRPPVTPEATKPAPPFLEPEDLYPSQDPNDPHALATRLQIAADADEYPPMTADHAAAAEQLFRLADLQR